MAKKKNKANVQKNRARKKQRIAAKKKRQHKAQVGARGFDGISRRAIREAPIHEVYVSSAIFDSGTGHVVVSRAISPIQLAVGVFMLDAFCLGVKDSFFRILDAFEYREMRDGMRGIEGEDAAASPEYARKLIDDAVAYAEALGFKPGGDFKDTYRVLESIDSNSCDEAFTFGHNGKPFYISGPYDSPRKNERIAKMLEARLGKDGYNILVSNLWDNDHESGDVDWEEEWDEDEDWDDENQLFLPGPDAQDKALENLTDEDMAPIPNGAPCDVDDTVSVDENPPVKRRWVDRTKALFGRSGK
jgi:hypothetical protein